MRNFLTVVIFFITLSLFGQSVNPNSWVMADDSTIEVAYTNPILPGFYPDPSVCRVGDDYYLVNSTFEYFPGVPIFHSKDLINWRQIGHCIHREDQIKGEINIFAPTIRYHDGIFYMITTNVSYKGNFFVTATNPEGPWSDAIWIDMPAIDPDLFFDDDGRAYVITSTFEMAEIDVKTGEILSEKRQIWSTTGGRYPEAPHIYKKDGFYYLMAAEGGTEEAHMVTIARSNNLWGPYINNPANPIATHVNHQGMGKAIQGIGHADIIQAHDESWWMVIHGYRTINAYPPHHILGRETCLVPVTWPKGGWPIINGNGTVDVEMKVETLPQTKSANKIEKVIFDSKELDLEWNYVQPPIKKNYKIDTKKGILSLYGSPEKLGEGLNPTFVGKRLRNIEFVASTRVDFNPKNKDEEAGIALLNHGSHFGMFVVNHNNERCVVVRLQFGQNFYYSDYIKLDDGSVDLKIEGSGPEFTFSFSQNGDDYIILDKADSKFLSSQTVGWFTGLYVGLYATGNGKAVKTPANYHWFEYIGK